MRQPIGIALQQAFEDVRGLSVPLGERLRIIADKVRALSPVYSDAVDVFVERLQQAGAGNAAPDVGDAMPLFVLPDDQGHLVSLEQLLEKAPVIVAFHRGHWCPYCRLNAVGLVEIDEAVKPVQIVAISAEMQAYTRAIKAEAGAHFPFLTDVGNGYAMSLGLSIWVDDQMAELIAGAGYNIPRYQGQDGWILPVPSVFVVGQDGLIKTRHVDPDYRKRMELDDLCAAAKAVLG